MTSRGSVAAASDEVEPWLRPWVKDQCEGATVEDLLGLLAAAALDRTLFDWDTLADEGVVHPAEFIRYNQGHLVATREGGDTWILRHDDGRLPVRLQLGSDTCVLLGPVVDDAALRGVARRSSRELDGVLAASKCDWRPTPATAWFGAALDETTPGDRSRDNDGGLRVLDPEDDGMRLVLAVVAAQADSAAARSLERLLSSPFGDDWCAYAATRNGAPAAALVVGGREGNDGIVWIGGAARDPAVALLVRTALFEAARGTVTTTITAEAGAAHDLAALGYRRLAPW